MTVKGVYNTKRQLTRAVDGLAAKGIPADSVSVYLLDEKGHLEREVPVEDEPGVLRGALIGAALGGGVGLATVLFSGIGPGRLGVALSDVLGLETLWGVLRFVVAAVAAGVPLGAILGLGHWQGRKKIPGSNRISGAALVAVDTESQESLARSVLEDTGAEQIRVT